MAPGKVMRGPSSSSGGVAGLTGKGAACNGEDALVARGATLTGACESGWAAGVREDGLGLGDENASRHTGIMTNKASTPAAAGT